MFEQIYKLIEYFITDKVKEIKSIDLFFDQFTQQFEGQTDNMPNPRLLIEIQEGEYTQRLGNYQIASIPVVLHIGIDIFETFERKSKILNKNFSYLKLIDDIYIKINQLTSYDLPEELQKDDIKIVNIERINFLMATNSDNIKVSTITFNFVVEDYRTDKAMDEEEYTIENNIIQIV